MCARRRRTSRGRARRQPDVVHVVGEAEHHPLRVHPERGCDQFGVHGVEQVSQVCAAHRPRWEPRLSTVAVSRSSPESKDFRQQTLSPAAGESGHGRNRHDPAPPLHRHASNWAAKVLCECIFAGSDAGAKAPVGTRILALKINSLDSSSYPVATKDSETTAPSGLPWRWAMSPHQPGHQPWSPLFSRQFSRALRAAGGRENCASVTVSKGVAGSPG